MAQALTVIQSILSILLVVFILLQTRGTGFGRAWGSIPSFTRRGIEKIVFRSTFFLSLLFLIISILRIII